MREVITMSNKELSRLEIMEKLRSRSSKEGPLKTSMKSEKL